MTCEFEISYHFIEFFIRGKFTVLIAKNESCCESFIVFSFRMDEPTLRLGSFNPLSYDPLSYTQSFRPSGPPRDSPRPAT